MTALAIVSPDASRTRPGLAERVSSLLARVDYRRAETAFDFDAIYDLRYQAYLREGAIAPNAERRLTDRFDRSPNVAVFGVFIQDRLASSIRIHVASSACPELPAAGVFSDYLEPEMAQGKIIIDPTRFVTERDASRAFPELPYVTVRLAWLAAEHFRAEHLLATVRAEHRAFYSKVFGHRSVCEPRVYPSLTKRIALMSADHATVAAAVYKRYPFFHSNLFERRMLFGQLQVPRRSIAA